MQNARKIASRDTTRKGRDDEMRVDGQDDTSKTRVVQMRYMSLRANRTTSGQ